MSRLHTLQDEGLDYQNNYDSILIVREIETTRHPENSSLQNQLSLQFYSIKKKENKKPNFKITTPKYKTYIPTAPSSLKSTKSLKTPVQMKSVFSPLEIKPSLQRIKLLVSQQKMTQAIDFRKFKKSIY